MKIGFSKSKKNIQVKLSKIFSRYQFFSIFQAISWNYPPYTTESLLLMEELLYALIDSLSQDLPGFIHLRWLLEISEPSTVSPPRLPYTTLLGNPNRCHLAGLGWGWGRSKASEKNAWPPRTSKRLQSSAA